MRGGLQRLINDHYYSIPFLPILIREVREDPLTHERRRQSHRSQSSRREQTQEEEASCDCHNHNNRNPEKYAAQSHDDDRAASRDLLHRDVVRRDGGRRIREGGGGASLSPLVPRFGGGCSAAVAFVAKACVEATLSLHESSSWTRCSASS